MRKRGLGLLFFGILLGAGVGFVAGLLLAPRSGAQTRRWLAGRARRVAEIARDVADNAERAARLGIARTIPRSRYTPARVAAELHHLLDNPTYTRRASAVREQMRQEDGVQVACDALSELLQRISLNSAK